MRLSVFFLLFLVAQTFATVTYSQQTRLTFKMQDAKVIDVLSKIEDESEFYFLFNQKLVDVERQVNVDVKDENVEKILSRIFENTNVSYLVKDRQIILTTAINSTKSGQGQQKSVSGKVTDATGTPLPGVSVVIKETSNGSITDSNGNFMLSNVPADATLQFSFVGMKTQEISVAGKTSINITMKEDAIGIEEVIAVGYGTLRKSDLTGTISTVDNDKLKGTPAVNFAEAMAGQVAGVQVQQTNGAPGGGNIMVRIRGGNSITAGNTPLYVLDGYPLENGNLNMLNPNDIQSIEILKDASASAIYGSRGGNGVVLITTKNGKGKQGRNVELNVHTGIQQVAHRPEMMDTYEYSQFFIDAHNNAWVQADPVTHKITDPNSARGGNKNYVIPDEFFHPENLPNTNWGDVIFQNAVIQNYQLNVTNSNDHGNSLIGGSYVNQEGTVIGTDYQKFNLHSNFFSKITDKISIGGNIDASYSFSHVS